MFVKNGKEFKHYGTPRHSGRYPWGSGDNPYQRNKSFVNYVNDMKKKGLSEKEIAAGMGISVRELRAKKSNATNEIRAADVAEAIRLHDMGMSNVAIGKQMGINESSVRSLLNETIQERKNAAMATKEVLRKFVEKDRYIDIGAGVEAHLGVSRNRLDQAVDMLKEEGYLVTNVKVKQLGTGKETTIKVIADRDVTWDELRENKEKINIPTDWSENGGRTFLGLEKPRDISEKRIQVAYKEDGGIEKDGLIEIRPGTPDLDLGKSSYAQVRISVDGTHYLKGMAVYATDLPDGVDIRFNTNKSKDTPKMDVFKKQKDDPDNPFGAIVRQKHYVDKDGKDQLSALNIVREEGDWEKWSKNLSSQFLSKQDYKFAEAQLKKVYDAKKSEFDEIMSLTNPVVRQKFLMELGDSCDSSAVSLKAAAMPRQSTNVIIPFPSLKETEIYAPNYRDGEKVVLIRHPHGGIFEIPELTVNNKNPAAKKTLGNAKDAVGINSKVAEQLSGADFDGDTVIVIPNNGKEIKHSAPLQGLKDFDPKTQYKGYPGMKEMTKQGTQLKMGDISNLITDMTIKGAEIDDICRAVRHSMVVIDAEKHKLNYTQSYIDNGVASLKEKYQGSSRSGASTIVSKASSEQRVGIRKEYIDKETGEKKYVYTGETYVNAKGETVLRTTKSTKMAEVSDARDLLGPNPTEMEKVYANHANSLKQLGNQCRKEAVNTQAKDYSPSANKAFANEVASLKAKLNEVDRNKPFERKAQTLANSIVQQKKDNNPGMDADTLKKIKFQALEEARYRLGAKKPTVDITPEEWNAIQAGALRPTTLKKVIDNTDTEKLRQYAMPKQETKIPDTKIARIKAMAANGQTVANIADALGLSVSTIQKVLD